MVAMKVSTGILAILGALAIIPVHTLFLLEGSRERVRVKVAKNAKVSKVTVLGSLATLPTPMWRNGDETTAILRLRWHPLLRLAVPAIGTFQDDCTTNG